MGTELPAWLERLDSALRVAARAAGPPYWHATAEPARAEAAPWNDLPADLSADVSAWWRWASAYDLGENVNLNLLLLPCGSPALPFEYALGHTLRYRQIALETWGAEADEFWSLSWLPLTAEQQGAWVIDLSSPGFPILYRALFGGDSYELAPGGIRAFAETLAELVESGCIVVDEMGGRWLRTDAPVPAAVNAEHVLLHPPFYGWVERAHEGGRPLTRPSGESPRGRKP